MVAKHQLFFLLVWVHPSTSPLESDGRWERALFDAPVCSTHRHNLADRGLLSDRTVQKQKQHRHMPQNDSTSHR